MTPYKTYSEYLRTPEFLELRRMVIERDGGLCVDCRSVGNQVHHTAYCKWGDLDRADDLVTVCFTCHEDRHRCDECGLVHLKAREIKAGVMTCSECSRDWENAADAFS